MNVILRKDTTKKDLVTFLHRAVCSPVLSTWVQAIDNNHFTTWPGLSKLVKKHLPKSIATAEGHIKQEKQGLQSTKTKKNSNKSSVDHNTIIKDYFRPPLNKTDTSSSSVKPTITHTQDAFSPSSLPNIKTNKVLYFLGSTDVLGTAYSDLTGRFPVQSSQGKNYLMIAYHQDANAILVEALKNRQAKSIVSAWSVLNKRFKKSGMKPSNWIMDNECSHDLKSALDAEKLSGS